MHDQTTAAALTAIAQGSVMPYATLPAGVMIAPQTRKPNRRPGAIPPARRTVGAVWHSWPAFLARYYLRQMWRDMPGPWPVKVALILVCLAIPGALDELLLIGLTRVFRTWRARQAAGRSAWDGAA